MIRGMGSAGASTMRDGDRSRRERRLQLLFLVLAGIFIGNALLAELIGGKLFQVPWGGSESGGGGGITAFGLDGFRFTLSAGIILWPVVFIMTDVVNEYFGRAGVKRISFIGAGVIAYAFFAVWLAEKVPTASFSPIDEQSFATVFIQSQWIIVGSIIAFLLAQLIDVTVFWIIRRRTGHRFLWLRATGSTVVSQLIDTFVVQFIGLHLPYVFDNTKGVDFPTLLNSASSGYVFKFLVAVAITPLLYVVHAAIDGYLGRDEAERVIEATADREGAGDTPQREKESGDSGRSVGRPPTLGR
jgi:uncharacterized integral membrane protein (TIGR00697 family)